MELPSTYMLDTETLKLNSYRLVCLFYANKEVSRTSDPEQPDAGAAKLERNHFAREMTYLVLSIAIVVRVLDDQMRALPENELDALSEIGVTRLDLRGASTIPLSRRV
jgi:hypothetical protein